LRARSEGTGPCHPLTRPPAERRPPSAPRGTRPPLRETPSGLPGRSGEQPPWRGRLPSRRLSVGHESVACSPSVVSERTSPTYGKGRRISSAVGRFRATTVSASAGRCRPPRGVRPRSACSGVSPGWGRLQLVEGALLRWLVGPAPFEGGGAQAAGIGGLAMLDDGHEPRLYPVGTTQLRAGADHRTIERRVGRLDGFEASGGVFERGPVEAGADVSDVTDAFRVVDGHDQGADPAPAPPLAFGPADDHHVGVEGELHLQPGARSC